jgi:predicted Rossmann fold flavoprotein
MKYNVAVIGGGPAGMIAAGRAGELGSHVVLIEKNKELGAKLLVTGKGRCNITNKINDIKKIIDKFGKNGKFLFSAFSKFGVDETINFFEENGLKTKVERGNRVFPMSDRSQDVLNTLTRYLRKSHVDIKINSEVRKIIKKDNKIEKILLTSGEEIIADNFIICTGGKSHPGTGSTGDGYKWAEKIGHTVTRLLPSLVPIIVKEKYVKRLEGLSLKNVEISIYKNKKKIISRFGEAIFTADGMSGPIILNMSKEIGKELHNKIKMQIDFKPALDFVKLSKRIQRDFQKNPNKLFRNGLNDLLPKKLIPVIVKLSKINLNKKVNSVNKEERKRLVHLLKEFSLEIKGLQNFKRAVITTGGIKLSDVDHKTMKSKLIDNLYFAGEILDLDGPTGGYNLQVCWTTGYIAGESIGQVSFNKKGSLLK